MGFSREEHWSELPLPTLGDLSDPGIEPHLCMPGSFIGQRWAKGRKQSKKAIHLDAFELWFWRRILSLLNCKDIQPGNPKLNQSWVFIGRTDAEAETPILWPPDVKNQLIGKDWERLKVGGEGDNRGWDSWMALPTQWTWVWVNSRSWWWIGRPGVLQSMGSQRVGHDWATELKWTMGGLPWWLRW